MIQIGKQKMYQHYHTEKKNSISKADKEIEFKLACHVKYWHLINSHQFLPSLGNETGGNYYVCHYISSLHSM